MFPASVLNSGRGGEDYSDRGGDDYYDLKSAKEEDAHHSYPSMNVQVLRNRYLKLSLSFNFL